MRHPSDYLGYRVLLLLPAESLPLQYLHKAKLLHLTQRYVLYAYRSAMRGGGRVDIHGFKIGLQLCCPSFFCLSSLEGLRFRKPLLNNDLGKVLGQGDELGIRFEKIALLCTLQEALYQIRQRFVLLTRDLQRT